jgi:hypothetical protein
MHYQLHSDFDFLVQFSSLSYSLQISPYAICYTTLPVVALSLMAHRGAPLSCACYMHHATCYAHSVGGCPVFWDASLSWGNATSCFTHSVSRCPISWQDDGFLGSTIKPCYMHAICYLHHATCYAHSAGGCPRFQDKGLQGAPPSCADAPPSLTLHVNALLFSGMTAHRLHCCAMQM